MRVVTTLRRKLSKSFRMRGALGTLRATFSYLRGRLRRLAPGRLAAAARDRDWDREHGVDTAGILPLSALDVRDEAWVHGIQYEPAPLDTVRRMLAALPIDHRDFTFVDLGSGKGRSMFLAADHPFRRIIGVELAPELHATCLKNMQVYRAPSQRCHRLEAVLGDAARFELPSEPCVVFLFNPFGPPVMREVLEGLRRSLSRQPRDILVAYQQPDHLSLFETAGFLARVASGPDWRIWRSVVSGPPSGSFA